MNHPLRTNPWVVCLFPFIVFMLLGSLEPAPPVTKDVAANAASPEASPQAASPKLWLDLGIEYRHYPLIYTGKIALTIAAMLFVWPGYRTYTRRLSFLGLAI